jgi:hypothetical protein
MGGEGGGAGSKPRRMFTKPRIIKRASVITRQGLLGMVGSTPSRNSKENFQQRTTERLWLQSFHK